MNQVLIVSIKSIIHQSVAKLSQLRQLVLVTGLVLATGCVQNMDRYAITATREFHYKQRVKVVSGFYSGRKGVVDREGRSYSDCHRIYYIILDDNGYDTYICNKHLIEDKGE